MSLTVRSPEELVAALPHVLGFKPVESLVFVPLRPDLPLARVDIPTTPREIEGVWGSVGDVFQRHAQPGASTAIVCVSCDRDNATRVSEEYVSRLAEIGIDVPIRLWADDVEWCDLATGDSGLQTDGVRDQLAAASVMDGRPRPAPSRAQLASSLVGDREPIANHLPDARATVTAASAREGATWAFDRVEQFHRDGVRLNDQDAARLLVEIESIPTRDKLWNTMTRDTSTSHMALWRDLTRRAPDEVRAAPAALLGFTAWLKGDGALAWCAIDQVPQDKSYSLANLVSAVLESGMHPREWEACRRSGMDYVPHQMNAMTGNAAQRTGPQEALGF